MLRHATCLSVLKGRKREEKRKACILAYVGERGSMNL